MSHEVTSITVKYGATRQLAGPYTSDTAEATLTAVLEDPDNALQITTSTLADAKGLVLASLGVTPHSGKDETEAVAVEVHDDPATPEEGREPTPIQRTTARRMCKENGISYDSVPGTGANGRVTVKDVQQYMASQLADDLEETMEPRPVVRYHGEDQTQEEQAGDVDTEAASLLDLLNGSEDEAEPELEPEPEAETTFTTTDLQRACGEAAKKVGVEPVKKAIASFGVTMINQLPADRYDELMAELEELQN